MLREAKIAWHGVKVGEPDWSPQSHSLAMLAALEERGVAVYVILNAYWEPLEFALPPVPQQANGSWRRWIDTSLDSPFDIVEWDMTPSVDRLTYDVGPRSVVVLIAPAGDT
jgi:isoamylase